ncbi:MAG: single-stranded DNA-binding protein [Pseudomonadota bacterium]
MLNQARVIGHVGRDPEIRSFDNGGAVAHMSIATHERWTNAAGDRVENTEWHRVAVFAGPKSEGLVGVVRAYVKRGSRILIEGQLKTRKWTDENGVERYSTEIHVRPLRGQLLLLDRKPAGGDAGPPAERPPSAPRGGGESAPSPAGVGMGDFDDEIPF